jgi:hypothetical protein
MKREVELLSNEKAARVVLSSNGTEIMVLHIAHSGNMEITATCHGQQSKTTLHFVAQDDKLLIVSERAPRFEERCVRSVWKYVESHLLS